LSALLALALFVVSGVLLFTADGLEVVAAALFVLGGLAFFGMFGCCGMPATRRAGADTQPEHTSTGCELTRPEIANQLVALQRVLPRVSMVSPTMFELQGSGWFFNPSPHLDPSVMAMIDRALASAGLTWTTAVREVNDGAIDATVGVNSVFTLDEIPARRNRTRGGAQVGVNQLNDMLDTAGVVFYLSEGAPRTQTRTSRTTFNQLPTLLTMVIIGATASATDKGSTSGAPSAFPENSAGARLQELKALHDMGLITIEQYDAKQQEVLSNM
jgi:hypothetical protein